MSIQVDSKTEINGDICRRYANGGWQYCKMILPKENALSLFINGQEMVTIQCTPEKLNCLVLGFLASQDLISSQDDITMMRICPDESTADVRLKRTVDMPTRRVLTSGCGGGTSFDIDKSLSPIRSDRRFSTLEVLSSMRLLLETKDQETGGRRKGLHVAALTNGKSLLVTAEDIGRHNTVDKVWGECLLRKIPTADQILVTTGRISSEMLLKAVRMKVPLVASFNSATDLAVELGSRLGVAIIGYASSSQFTVFCGNECISEC